MKVILLKCTICKNPNESCTAYTWGYLEFCGHDCLNKQWKSHDFMGLPYFDQECDFVTRREAIQHLKRTTKYKKIDPKDIALKGGSKELEDIYEITPTLNV